MYASSTLVALLVASAVAAAPLSDRRDQLRNVNMARASKAGKIAKGAPSKSIPKVSVSGILDSLSNGLNSVEQGINLFNGFSAVLGQLPTPAAVAPALSTPAAITSPTNSTAQNMTGSANSSSGNTPSKRFTLPFGSGLCQIFPEGTVFTPEEQAKFEKECVPHSTVITSTSAPAVTTPSAPASTSSSLIDGPERRSSNDGITANGLDPATLAALRKLVTRALDELD